MPELALVCGSSGLWLLAGLSLFFRQQGTRFHLPLCFLAALAGILSALLALFDAPLTAHLSIWNQPVSFELDGLSAAFLLPLHFLAALGCFYAQGYRPFEQRMERPIYQRFFYCLLVFGLSLVFVSRQGQFFIFVWEIMAVSAFFLVLTEYRHSAARQAAWVYLVSTHLGTLSLMAAFFLWFQRCGSMEWAPLTGEAQALDSWILALSLFGFAFKAGLVPLHFWLPPAHAAAPSHASALLSGLMLKSGIYGILRMSSFFPHLPLWFGVSLLCLGSLSALYGVLHCLAQSDFKRLLAYSSVENLGIIALAIGVGLLGRSLDRDWMVALGFGGALFHVWNHALFKNLLFLAAGAILHATGSRNLEILGGLAKKMPKTCIFLLPGVLAAIAVPPLNGFLSEWLIYRGLFQTIPYGLTWIAGLALPILALSGGLAFVAFGKLFAILFLGSARKPNLPDAVQDPPFSMLAPMAVLAVCCLLLSLSSPWLLATLDQALALIAPGTAIRLEEQLFNNFLTLVAFSASSMLLILGVFLWLRRGARSQTRPLPPSWDCAYAAPQPRMQYGGFAFSQILAPILPLRVHGRPIEALFPASARFRVAVRDLWESSVLNPRFHKLAQLLCRWHKLQPGYMPLYLFYLLLTLVIVFMWMILRQKALT